MTERANTPKLRFPEFNNDWTTNQAKNLFTNVSDKKHDGDLLVLSATQDKGMVPRQDLDLEIKYDKKNLSNYKRTLPNDFIISLRSFQGGFELNTIEGIVSPAYTVLRGEEELAQPKFFKQYFKSIRFIKKLDSMIYGIRDGKSISYKEFSTFSINYPSILEQQKIGDFFSKLDRQIELEEQKLAKLEEQKKGYMQKLFSQELRFKDQDGNDYPKWEKKFIKDIFIFENNRRKPITSSLREKGLYPYYGATGIIDYVKDYLFNNEERLLIGEDGAKWGQFENSSFIANGQYWVNNHAHVVKSNNHNLYFMNYYLNFKELRTFVTGNAPAKLTHANLCNISLEIPCLNEQGKISALLKSIDKKINNQINKIVLLKRRKQGLLQKMFV